MESRAEPAKRLNGDKLINSGETTRSNDTSLYEYPRNQSQAGQPLKEMSASKSMKTDKYKNVSEEPSVKPAILPQLQGEAASATRRAQPEQI